VVFVGDPATIDEERRPCFRQQQRRDDVDAGDAVLRTAREIHLVRRVEGPAGRGASIGEGRAFGEVLRERNRFTFELRWRAVRRAPGQSINCQKPAGCTPADGSPERRRASDAGESAGLIGGSAIDGS
jgi:hypothetical protein